MVLMLLLMLGKSCDVYVYSLYFIILKFFNKKVQGFTYTSGNTRPTDVQIKYYNSRYTMGEGNIYEGADV